MPHVYVTGHKNPDTDTIASAIGYAEFKNLVDADNEYAPARLGEVNPQTAWALEKSGAEEPRLLEHIMLRVKDLMARFGHKSEDAAIRYLHATKEADAAMAGGIDAALRQAQEHADADAGVAEAG